MSILQVIEFVVVGFVIFTRAIDQDSAITVNIESFEELMTKRISRLDSKVDSILATCGNNPATVDAEANHKICSISSRMIEMENVIAALKSSPLMSSSGTHPVTPSFEVLSKLESKIENIQEWIAKEDSRMKRIEQKMEEFSSPLSSPSANSEVELGTQTCIVAQFNGKNLATYLMRVNSNIFYGKLTNASTTLDDNAKYRPMAALDGELTTFYHSKKQSNPWMFVDLGIPHFIIEVRVTIRDAIRVSKIKLFGANNATFFRNGGLKTDLAQDFGAPVLSTDVKTVVFRAQEGACARYLLLYRAIENEYLIVVEMQGIGYPFPKV